jgi:flagellar hook-basal body complex protein FliE
MEPISGDFNVRRVEADLAPLGGDRAGAPPPGGVPFKDVLEGMIDRVDSLQKDADASIRELVAGEGTDLHTVALRMNEAEVAFDLMMEVRNELLDAYRDVMKMQP